MEVSNDIMRADDNVIPAEQQPTEENQVVNYKSVIDTDLVSDNQREKILNYDIDSAVAELTDIIHGCSEMYYQLKKIKFDYIMQTCQLCSRVDFPSIMMETCRKEITNSVPKAKDIGSMNSSLI